MISSLVVLLQCPNAILYQGVHLGATCHIFKHAAHGIQLHRHRHQHRRHVASHARSNAVKALPFALTPDEAKEKFSAYHETWLKSASLSRLEKLEETFLPFYHADARIRVWVRSARIGRAKQVLRYNTRSKRLETQRVIDWDYVTNPLFYDNVYHSNSDKNMQVYASYHHKRPIINSIRTLIFEHQTVNLGIPSMLEAHDGGTRKVEPFTMDRMVAKLRLQRYIQQNEYDRTIAQLKRLYAADEVENIDLKIQYDIMNVKPIYVPAYVFKLRYLKKSFKTFVNAYSGHVGGQQFYQFKLIGAATFTGSLLYTLAFGGTFYSGVFLPTFFTTIASIYWPLIMKKIHGFQREWEQNMDAIRGQSSYAKYGTSEEQETYQEERNYQSHQRYENEWRRTYSRQQAQRQTQGTHSQDPKGYYAALGVKTTASKEDIQASFRGLALKYHPDRFREPKEKQEAQTKFKKISEAYSVLRDPKKRARYDSTGQS